MPRRPIILVKILAMLCVVFVLGIYFFYQSRTLLTGPQLTVDYPKNGQTLTGSFLVIKGRALNTSSVLVNGQSVLADGGGNFERKLLLAEGYNIIELTAEDKFGRIINKKLEVVLK